MLTCNIETAGKLSIQLWKHGSPSRNQWPSPCMAASEGLPAWCFQASGQHGSAPGSSASLARWRPAAGLAGCTWASEGWTCCASESRKGSAPASQTQGTCDSCAGNTRTSGQSWTHRHFPCSACWGYSPASRRKMILCGNKQKNECESNIFLNRPKHEGSQNLSSVPPVLKITHQPYGRNNTEDQRSQ